MSGIAKKKQILVYDHDDQQIQLLESSLSGDQFQLTITNDYQNISNSFDYAFVSLNLPAVEIDSKIKIICTNNPSMPQVTPRTHYRPLVSLTAPLTKTEVIRAFDFIDNKHKDGASQFLSNVVDLQITLKGMINEIKSSPVLDLSLDESLKQYCTRECSSSESYDRKQTREFKKEELVDLNFAGHIKVCSRRPTCKLCQFQEYMLKEHREISAVSIGQRLGELQSLSINDLNSKITSYLDDIINLKTCFCTSQCEDKKNDMNFRPGDTLLVSYQELLKGECHYCSTKNCNIRKFFSIFLDIINNIESS